MIFLDRFLHRLRPVAVAVLVAHYMNRDFVRYAAALAVPEVFSGVFEPAGRLRWSGPYRATPSGAVSAGSNPAGGAAQRHKFEHSDNLGRSGARPVTCGNVELSQIWCPIRARIPPPYPRVSPAQRRLAFTVSGPFGDARPLALAPVLQLRGDRGHSPTAAKDVPPAIPCETCLPEGDNPWPWPHGFECDSVVDDGMRREPPSHSADAAGRTFVDVPVAGGAVATGRVRVGCPRGFAGRVVTLAG